MTQQLAFGAMALAAGDKPASKEQIDKLIMDGVKAITIHEVGHTLGLRHNFIASTWLTIDEINDPEKTRNTGLAASVMDYLPVNISPKGKKQGELLQHRGRPLRLLGHRICLQAASAAAPKAKWPNWRRSPRAAPSRPCNTPPTKTPACSIPIRW